MKLRILFLCGGLEPGCDGVGDYTRLLAEECVRQGHACALISLKDRFVHSNPQGHHVTSDNVVNILRFKNAFSDHDTFKTIEKYVGYFNPNWTSLQFVPYAFNSRGINFGLAKKVLKIGGKKSIHCMFHETWIGFNKEDSLKNKIIGGIQKRNTQSMLQTLEVKAIHTHTKIYQNQIHEIGFDSSILPLFGSVKLCEPPATESWFYPTLQDQGIEIDIINRDQFLIFGIFGSLHPNWPPEPLLGYISEGAKKMNKKPALVHFGHMGPGKKLWSKIKKSRPEIKMVALGPLLSSNVWTTFRSIDFGIATTPYSLITKSISVASMMEAGLPVIVNRIDSSNNPGKLPANHENPLLIKMTDTLPEDLSGYTRQEPSSNLKEIGSQFIDDLKKAY